jgi:hypothetical protein
MIVCFTCCLQTQVRNQQAQDTSVNITRGARTLKGRLPTVEESLDPVVEWKSSVHLMRQALTNGTFTPFKIAIEKGLLANGSNIDAFMKDGSSMLRRRRLYKADGSSVRDAAAGDASSAQFLTLMQLVTKHMIEVSNLTLQDCANYEMFLFFDSCLLGVATLRDQTYRRNLINDVYMDQAGHINEAIFAPLQLKVTAGVTESGHLLIADVKSKECTLAWLIMICAVRPMRAALHSSKPVEQIWGLSGVDNHLVSKAAWANRIKQISKLHLGSPRTGMY